VKSKALPFIFSALLSATSPLASGARAEDTPLPLLNAIQDRHVAIQQLVAPAIVEVQSSLRIDAKRSTLNYGSGTVISADGLILTCTTCCPPGAEEIQVTFPDGRQFTASLLDYDEKTEVRVLKVTDAANAAKKPFAFVQLVDSSKAHVGDLAYTAGNPFHTISRDGQVAWSVGTISGIYNLTTNCDKCAHYRGQVLETDAAVNRGSDGGPLIDANGRLLGVLTMSYGKSRWMGLAIPVHLVKANLARTLQNVPMIDPSVPFKENQSEGAKAAREMMDGLSIASKPAQAAMVKLIVTRRNSAPRPPAPLAGPDDLPNPGGERPDTPVSGVVFEPQGYILTSAFNVEGEDTDKPEITVVLSNGLRLSAERRGRNFGQDVAVLKVNVPKGVVLPYIPLAKDPELRLGRFVTVLGASEDGAAPTRTMGVVSAVGRLDGGVVQTDALINYGNSGGAVIDLRGNLVGIASHLKLNSEWSQPNSGVGFFAQSDKILVTIGDLKANLDIRNPVRESRLGTQTLDEAPEIQGVAIDKIEPGSVFARAQILDRPGDRLRESDVVVNVDGMETPNPPTLVEVLKAHNPGDVIDITCMRNRKTLHARATLGGN